GEESGAEPANGAYICEDDRFPGKQAIKKTNNDSLIFVIDEELFRITGEDGTEAAAYGGRSFLCDGETETALEYESAILCGNQLFLHKSKLEKIGENLAYCFYGENSYDAAIYFVENSHVMHLPCNGAPKVREGVDNVFFMSENAMSIFAEWIVMGKDGKLRSLPAFDGKRYIIKSVEYASDEGGGVDVTAYRWNADDLAY
ncbi:MAG: hypothetical protein J5760_04170, partial [Clostridia bacterium]|nr:hypothetical protein [Clostridia bacterium]